MDVLGVEWRDGVNEAVQHLSAEARASVRAARDVEARGRVARTARVEAALERQATGEPAAAPVVSTRSGDHACRTPGCSNRANARYTRGPYSGLCVEVCIPRRRGEISEQQRQAWKEKAEGPTSSATSEPPAQEAETPTLPSPEPEPTVDGLTELRDGEEFAQLGERTRVLIEAREEALARAVKLDAELQIVLTHLRRLADEWIVEVLDGPPLVD
jgi:hypothetical protein